MRRPAVLPDLYRGEPLALAAKVGALAGTLEIKGMIGDRPWTVTLPLADAAEGRGLSKLWARRKIADAEVARTLRQITPDEADQRDSRARPRAPSGDAIDQPGRRRPDAEPPRRRASDPCRACRSTSRPAGSSTRCSAASARRRRSRRSAAPRPRRRRLAQLDGYAAVTASAFAEAGCGRSRSRRPARAAARSLPKTATDAELRLWLGLMLCARA